MQALIIHRPLCKAFYNLLAYIVYDLFAKNQNIKTDAGVFV